MTVEPAAGPAVAAFFDLDGTVTSLDSFVLLGLYARWRRLGNLSLRRFAGDLTAYGRGRLNNHELKEMTLAQLRGTSREELTRFCSDLFRRLVRPTVRPRMRARLEQHNRRGHVTVLLSASLEEQLRPAAAFLGARGILGSRTEFVDDRLTGRLQGAVCHGDEKARLAAEYCRSRGIEPRESFAYGDSTSDLPVLELCGHPCVVNGDRQIVEIASRRGWEILKLPFPLLSMAKAFTVHA